MTEANNIIGDFPFEEIRKECGNYFDTIQECKDAGFDEDQIWSIVVGDDNEFCYGPSHHYVNFIGYVCTKERHDGFTYYIEEYDFDDEDEEE